MIRYCLAVLFVLASFTSLSSAGVEIKKTTGEARHVQADTYTADIAADGALTSIVYKGQDLLTPGVGVSRGAYCFARGVVALDKFEQPNDTTVVVKADGKPAVTYGFEANAVNISVANTTASPLLFVLVLDPAFNVVARESGQTLKVPTKQAWADSTWFTADKQARITGASSLWGPYLGNTNVVQADIAPGQTRKLTVQLADIAPADAPRVAEAREGKVVEAELTIDSPTPWQVFQRRTKAAGILRVSGHVKSNADAAEVRIAGKSIDGDLPDKWQAVSIDPATHLFNGELPTPAGGWYTVQIRAKAGDKDLAHGEVANVGIGEVFVIAGQSNSTNYGEKRLEPASGLASTFDGTSWRVANDPQPGTHDNSTGGSPWAPFADAMAEHYHVPIGIASTGHGGTSINAWLPGSELLRHTQTRIAQLGPFGFRAVLWHQGESDAEQMPTDEYVTKMAAVIADSRHSAGWAFPWFVAQATFHPKDKVYKSIRDAQQHIWDQGIALPGPDTDTLTGDNRDTNGAGIHLSEKGLRAHGKMWQEKVSAWLDKTLEIAPPAK